MKTKRALLIGVMLGGLLGGSILLLLMPVIVAHASFLLGFLACVGFLCLGFLLLYVWNQHPQLQKLFGNPPTNRSGISPIRWIVGIFAILAIGLGVGYWITQQQARSLTQQEYHEQQLQIQSDLLSVNQNRNLLILMSSLLEQVEGEIKEQPEGPLQESTISRIVALSHSFQAYTHSADSLPLNKLSPERGQLLRALAVMQIDSTSFDTIKARATFAGADLVGADLRGTNLRGINLWGANLKDAQLEGANLQRADLRKANLWGANLSHTDLQWADLKRTYAYWADFYQAEMDSADLNNIYLRYANLKEVDLQGAMFQWADVRGTKLNGADFTGADLLVSDFSETDLTNCNFTGANLRRVIFRDADFSEVTFDWTAFQFDGWWERMEEWHVQGREEMKARYHVLEDTAKELQYHLAKYRIVPKDSTHLN